MGFCNYYVCFVERYFVSIPFMQSSWWGRESWLLCFWSSMCLVPRFCSLWLWYFLIILTYNFDKDHYTDLHRVQCSEHTPLANNNFRSFFFSNSTKLWVVIENALGYSFSCKSLTRRFHECLWVEKCKMSHFRNFTPKNQVYFSDISKDQKYKMFLRNIFFNLSIFGWNLFVTEIIPSGYNYYHLKSMDFYVKSNILHFHSTGHTLDHPVWDLHLNL